MGETINDRIEMLVNERFDGNKAAFAKSIGLPPTGMSSYLGKQRRSKPSVDMVTKIITKLNVDARWLLAGEAEILKPKSAADGEPSITTGEGSVLINSGGSRVDTNSGAVIYKALGEIAEQRKLTAKAHEQIDRLLAIIDRLTSGVNKNNQ